ncbi:DUF7344 domain-containing protein [Natrinema caseinilyticum]|uniref:DUF7344 domain-containing protein n=1 Tax=Natrinema caseinilyticum TaxID=2961570 RepID=UPI003CCE1F23
MDRLLTSIAGHRRRYVLYYVVQNEITTIDRLAEHVASASNDVPKRRLTEEQFEETRAGLTHSALPQLREAGIVDYDARSGTVRYRQQSQILSRLLRVCADFETPAASFD